MIILAWYIAADRLTPYTSQARVEGFVVGVAPKVAGLVTEVNIRNNQQVAAGEVLFVIDDSDYLIAVERAESELEKAQQQLAAGDAGVVAARAGLDAALANQDGGVVVPASTRWVDAGEDLPLFDGRMQCATCHDAHNGTPGPFMRRRDTGTASICVDCHA